MRGTTRHIFVVVVVVSPLVNVMKDQVVKLANIGVPAVTRNNISEANVSVEERGAYRFFKKYNQISRSGPWSATHDLGGITFRRIKGNGLCFRRMFWKSSLHTFTSSLFLILRIHTEILVIVFDRAENCSALMWETVVSSLSKKSRLF